MIPMQTPDVGAGGNSWGKFAEQAGTLIQGALQKFESIKNSADAVNLAYKSTIDDLPFMGLDPEAEKVIREKLVPTETDKQNKEAYFERMKQTVTYMQLYSVEKAKREAIISDAGGQTGGPALEQPAPQATAAPARKSFSSFVGPPSSLSSMSSGQTDNGQESFQKAVAGSVLGQTAGNDITQPTPGGNADLITQSISPQQQPAPAPSLNPTPASAAPASTPETMSKILSTVSPENRDYIKILEDKKNAAIQNALTHKNSNPAHEAVAAANKVFLDAVNDDHKEQAAIRKHAEEAGVLDANTKYTVDASVKNASIKASQDATKESLKTMRATLEKQTTRDIAESDKLRTALDAATKNDSPDIDVKKIAWDNFENGMTADQATRKAMQVKNILDTDAKDITAVPEDKKIAALWWIGKVNPSTGMVYTEEKILELLREAQQKNIDMITYPKNVLGQNLK
jgi:hypothetical protein